MGGVGGQILDGVTRYSVRCLPRSAFSTLGPPVGATYPLDPRAFHGRPECPPSGEPSLTAGSTPAAGVPAVGLRPILGASREDRTSCGQVGRSARFEPYGFTRRLAPMLRAGRFAPVPGLPPPANIGGPAKEQGPATVRRLGFRSGGGGSRTGFRPWLMGRIIYLPICVYTLSATEV